MRFGLLALALAACPAEAPPAPVPGAIQDAGEVLLTVDGTPVGRAELGLVFERMGKDASYADTKAGRHVAEEYALATALYQKALADKLHEDPKVALQIAFAARQVLASAEREKLAKAAVTDAKIQEYYEQNKARFEKPEVKLRRILVGSESLAKELISRIQQGEDFGAVAKAHSMDANAPKGGEMGWVKRHEAPEIGEAVFAAKKGDLLGPIEGRLGFHIVEVLDARDRTPLEEVRPEAEQQLTHAEATRVIEELRKSIKIEWTSPPKDLPNPPPPAPMVLPPGHSPVPEPGAVAPGSRPGKGPKHP